MTVSTGSEQKTWHLPKKVLTHCSPFFDAALNGNFVEASSKAVDLPEDDPIAFGMWATWLTLGECEGSDDGYLELGYVLAWELGEKFACPAFKDHVMDCLLSWLEFCDLQSNIIRIVYRVSSPGSKLRRVFVDVFVWSKLEGHLTSDADKFIRLLGEVPEFSEDSVKRELKVGKYNNPWKQHHQYYENPAFKPDA